MNTDEKFTIRTHKDGELIEEQKVSPENAHEWHETTVIDFHNMHTWEERNGVTIDLSTAAGDVIYSYTFS